MRNRRALSEPPPTGAARRRCLRSRSTPLPAAPVVPALPVVPAAPVVPAPPVRAARCRRAARSRRCPMVPRRRRALAARARAPCAGRARRPAARRRVPRRTGRSRSSPRPAVAPAPPPAPAAPPPVPAVPPRPPAPAAPSRRAEPPVPGRDRAVLERAEVGRRARERQADVRTPCRSDRCPATRCMKPTLGRLPSAWRGAMRLASRSGLTKSAALTVTGSVHELNVSVPPLRLAIVRARSDRDVVAQHVGRRKSGVRRAC